MKYLSKGFKNSCVIVKKYRLSMAFWASDGLFEATPFTSFFRMDLSLAKNGLYRVYTPGFESRVFRFPPFFNLAEEEETEEVDESMAPTFKDDVIEVIGEVT